MAIIKATVVFCLTPSSVRPLTGVEKNKRREAKRKEKRRMRASGSAFRAEWTGVEARRGSARQAGRQERQTEAASSLAHSLLLLLGGR